jgi:hypothetical protein
MATKPNAFLLLSGLLIFFFASGCYRTSHYRTLREAVDHPVKSTKVLAVYVPWFGDPQHINVGYTTDNPAVIRKQIAKAKEMGVDVFAVNWYGPREPFLDHSYALIQKIASENHFQVAIMFDEMQEDNGRATDDALAAMDKAYNAYLRPGAPGRDAYLEYDGRPVIFIFPKRGRTDWNRVRAQVDTWPVPPLLIYKDDPPPQYEKAFDGKYAWVHPGKKGWTPDGSDWGKDYLDAFYKKMEKQPGKIAVGGAWPGFDDTKASWSLDRHISPRCGKTFEDTLRMFQQFNQVNPMPYLMIATWNDYEEGTAIERGVPNCGS